MFIRTVSPAEADGEIASIYAKEVASMGSVMQATQCWSARPDILAPVEHLLHQIRDGFSLGLINFRLVTLIAAKSVPSSYCSHVYFKALSTMIGREDASCVSRLSKRRAEQSASSHAGVRRANYNRRIEHRTSGYRCPSRCWSHGHKYRRYCVGRLFPKLLKPLLRCSRRCCRARLSRRRP